MTTGTLVPVFAALGDETRWSILAALGEGDASASALAGRLPVTRQAIAKHLAVLQKVGLVEPVRVGREVRGLMRDLKAIGAHNVTRGRPAGLSGKSVLSAVARAYEAHRREGKLPATFEVVYGHAWKPQARVSPTGRPVIDIHPSVSRES